MIRAIAIVIAATILGLLIDWRFPAIDRFLWDTMRGSEAVPPDIVIVAIDDHSIEQLGPFPWPRSIVARAIDAIAASHPKAIALDVLYVNPTSAADDGALASAISKAGNVVVAAQVDEMPLPEIAHAAAAVGHVNVDKDAEGFERELVQARSLRPMALETVRVGGGSLGPAGNMPRLTIDFIGPPGSFAKSTSSLADALDGRTPPGAFNGKYVLIGATAASLGNRVNSGRHGEPMTGVEVLANAVNTILRSRFYSETRAANQVLYTLLTAVLTMTLLVIGRRRIIVTAGLIAAIAVIGYLAVNKSLVHPPFAAVLVAFASTALLERLTARSSR